MARRSQPKTSKTYEQLLDQLGWLGPALLVKAFGPEKIAGPTIERDREICDTVYFYLQEHGFNVRAYRPPDRSYALAIETADVGWICVDLVRARGHLAKSLPEAIEKVSHLFSHPFFIDDALVYALFAQTVQWSLNVLQDGLKAFEIEPLGFESLLYAVEFNYKVPRVYKNDPTQVEDWETWWSDYKELADRVAQKILPSALKHDPWSELVVKRLREKTRR